MSPLRYRDDEPSSSGVLFVAAGAIAGLAAGILIAQRFGGFAELTGRIREQFGALRDRVYRDEIGEDRDDYDEYEDEDHMAANADEYDAMASTEDGESLESRVLEAFRNDPVLSARAVDIGEVGNGIIELTGWVHTPGETEHAVTVAAGVPGVETVLNRLTVGAEESQRAETARRYAAGDDSLTEARWEGQQVGTGRRRQGNSAESDRHADPRTELEERWMREDKALAAAAEDVEGMGERRRGAKKAARGDRTGGAPVAPTGVPKGDHVADPESATDTGGAANTVNDKPRAD